MRTVSPEERQRVLEEAARAVENRSAATRRYVVASPSHLLTGPSAVAQPTSTVTGEPDPNMAEKVARARADTIARVQSSAPPGVPKLIVKE